MEKPDLKNGKWSPSSGTGGRNKRNEAYDGGKHQGRNNARKVFRDEKLAQLRTKVNTLYLSSVTLRGRNKHLLNF